ncbi:MAG TPA: hypothetical protein VEC99_01240 [Clostridia bacterium]|nr:hypothetical protein [Clostridia bacterium]
MKTTIIFAIAAIATIAIQAQVQPPPTDSILTAPRSSAPTTNELGAGSLTFTNQAGTTISVTELNNQLKTLRSVIDQTLPMLEAFNTNFAPMASGNLSIQSIAGILSRVLSGNTNNPAGQNTTNTRSNVVGLLQSLLTTNSASSVSLNPEALTQLRQLQENLEPIPPLLQDLNIGSATPNVPSGDIGYNPAADTNILRNPANTQTNRQLAPTGR